MGGESGALMQSQTRNEDSLEFVNNKERVQLSELHKRMVSHQQQHKQEVEHKAHHHHEVHHLTKHHDSVTGVSTVETGHMGSMKKTAREMEHEYRTILEMMVQQPTLGTEYQPPDSMITDVEAVFDVIEDQLVSEKTTSQAAIDGANAEIKVCGDNKRDGYTKPHGINDWKAWSDESRGAHTECRVQENSMICTTRTECDKFNGQQQKSCEHEQNWYVKVKDPAVTAPSIPALEQLIRQAETCRSKLAAEHEHAAVCDYKQGDFEIAFCRYADRLQKVSDEYNQCYEMKDAFRTKEVKKVEILERDGKLIWKMVKKIRCYIETLKTVEYSGKLPLQGEIDTCTGLDPETSPLDIAYTAAEPYEACDLTTIQSWPGKADKQFYQDEYSGPLFQNDCKKGDEAVPDHQKALNPEKLTNVEVCTYMNSWHSKKEGGGLMQTGSSSSV